MGVGTELSSSPCVSLSVCQLVCVCQVVNCGKTVDWIWMLFRVVSGISQGWVYWMGVEIVKGEGQFWG